jgi:hypothetical protein
MSAQAPPQAAPARPLPVAGRSGPRLQIQRKCACGGSASALDGECEECQKKRLQPKLVVGSTDDPLEREADRVAEQVMAPPRGLQALGWSPPRIQRAAAQPMGGAGVTPPSVTRALASAGRPLEPALCHDMEQRFGHDFARVRVHAGPFAEQAARDVNAHAFTVGRDIVFGADRFSPATGEGRRLLAHELTHVVQQSDDASPGIVRRSEVDDRSCAGLTDIESDVDTKVQSEIAAAKTAAGTPLTGSRLGNFLIKVRDNLGKGAVSPIEDFVESLPASKRKLPGTLAGTKYAGAQSFNTAYSGQALVGAPKVVRSAAKVAGFCIGADKLGHFFSEGFFYFVQAVGGASASDIEDIGRGLEIGVQGLGGLAAAGLTTGVFSNADRAANRKGLQFYRDLLATPTLTFSIKNYVAADWNEQTNPSFYASGLGAIVWRNLLAGRWEGSFTSGGAPAGGASSPKDIAVDLTATATSVTGTYQWPIATPAQKGKINGTITPRTTAVSGVDPTTTPSTPVSASPVSGITIDFDWEEGKSKGKGRWESLNEQELAGTWGIGASRTDGGIWNVKKA